jgi:hypothetical protein
MNPRVLRSMIVWDTKSDKAWLRYAAAQAGPHTRKYKDIKRRQAWARQLVARRKLKQ